jgi:hypothetical protein
VLSTAHAADYKAANSKTPTQKAPDPWADVRQAPAGSGQKASASTQNASAQKKKQSAVIAVVAVKSLRGDVV